MTIQKHDIYSMKEFVKYCGGHPLVTAKEVFVADFADYDRRFNEKVEIFSCNIDNKKTDMNQNDYSNENGMKGSKHLLLLYCK
jgi:hypothetical protein